MGFPVGYPHDMLLKLFLLVFSFFGLIRAITLTTLALMGLSEFLQESPTQVPNSRARIRELVPVIKLSDAAFITPVESCAVCLCEFLHEEEIRWLRNSCKHIFHKSCLDRWIDQDHITCPLCRTAFAPPHLVEEMFCLDYSVSAATDDYGLM